MGDRILFGIFLIFTVSTAIQIFYYCYYYLAVHYNRESRQAVSLNPVSVIICARNEASNLREFLPAVLSQDYPDYEVIVVNDCSEDETYNVLGEYLAKYPRLRVSTINKDPKFTHSKKLAQFIGIKAAKNEILVFTDADCKPDSDQWLKKIASRFDQRTSYVLGYGGYFSAKGLLNAYIRYDTAFIAMQYLGMAIRGIPYMGVGRNMAYRKEEFFRNRGYGFHSSLISGDDDLFINSNAAAENTTVEYGPESATRSVAAASFEEWVKQKKRHLTTAPYYKQKDQLLLIVEPLTRMIFYLSLIVLLSFKFMWIEVLAIFSTRLITQATVFPLVQKKLVEPGLVGYSLFFDIFSPLINGFLFISKGKAQGKNQWSS
ncbi:MAG TPA: glycosyltransferase [Bacteroidales bacterium]|nr:glycosyltransferase [Bacteroidales bacterium]